MSLQIALSGLNAASADLSVTANNIANVGTTGFKESRTEFADLFPISTYGTSSSTFGGGVYTSAITQQFDQGNISASGNALDLAISGDGFFTVSQAGSLLYTRSGAFGTNADGYVVNSSGQRLQIFPPLANGTFDTANLSDLQLSTSTNAPKATTGVTATFNLPADASAPATTTFDATDATSYNQATAVTVYDSLGVAHQANMYFVKGSAANSWDVHVQVDGTDAGTSTVTYSDSGTLLTPAGGAIPLSYTPTNGAAAMSMNLDVSKSTQYGSTFSTNTTQDGYATGQLTTIAIGDDGIVEARYSNGQATALGQVALTRFANPQGLQQMGNNAWASTFAAGTPQVGTAGSPSFGTLKSGALESSNVDITAQLVHMITAQRNFQANAQMISTEDQVTQTIINLR